jgi:hypothetical protein
MALCTEEMWIARDVYGDIYLYYSEPIKKEFGFISKDRSPEHLDSKLFPELTFENSPKKVKITFEL